MAERWRGFAKNVAIFATWYVPVFILCFAARIGWSRATAWAFGSLLAGGVVGYLVGAAICAVFHCSQKEDDSAKDRGDD